MAPLSERMLDGRVAFVTGANHSRGLHLALSLAKQGCRLLLAGDPATLASITDGIKVSLSEPGHSDNDIDVTLVPMDVTEGEESVNFSVSKAWNIFGRIDILVNSDSYFGSMKSALEISREEWIKTFSVNLCGCWLVTKVIGRYMRDSGISGSIIFMTSIIGTERGLLPGISAYSTSMAAVTHLTKTLALELGKFNIRVNAVATGISDSDAMYQSLHTDNIQKLKKEALPLGRWADVSKDLSSTIIYLAGDFSTYVTGTVIVIDGGQSLVRPRMRSFM